MPEYVTRAPTAYQVLGAQAVYARTADWLWGAVAEVAAVAVPIASGTSNAAPAITDPRRIFRNGAPALGG
ncbi:hypothetical protein Mro03_46010 [Microbispora rosea subsp. rosea]|nr:hypothetical protein Mro03_46010 [Microbispora rosea subsp. rosea]